MIVIQVREMICYATGGEVYIAAQMHTIVRKKSGVLVYIKYTQLTIKDNQY